MSRVCVRLRSVLKTLLLVSEGFMYSGVTPLVDTLYTPIIYIHVQTGSGIFSNRLEFCIDLFILHISRASIQINSAKSVELILIAKQIQKYKYTGGELYSSR